MFHLDQGDSRCLPSISSGLNGPLNMHYILKSLPNVLLTVCFHDFLIPFLVLAMGRFW